MSIEDMAAALAAKDAEIASLTFELGWRLGAEGMSLQDAKAAWRAAAIPEPPNAG